MPATLPTRHAEPSVALRPAPSPARGAAGRPQREPTLDARVGAWADRYRVIVGWCAPASADVPERVSQRA